MILSVGILRKFEVEATLESPTDDDGPCHVAAKRGVSRHCVADPAPVRPLRVRHVGPVYEKLPRLKNAVPLF